MGIVTTSSQTTFRHAPEVVYDFVTNPANWTKTYPGSSYVGDLTDLPLKVGDTWKEAGSGENDQVYEWHLAIAMRPKLWVFNSVGLLGQNQDGSGGFEGRITVEYHFTQPGPDTLFTRTMTIEAYRHAPMPNRFFRIVNPVFIDQYHAAVARELDAAAG